MKVTAVCTADASYPANLTLLNFKNHEKQRKVSANRARRGKVSSRCEETFFCLQLNWNDSDFCLLWIVNSLVRSGRRKKDSRGFWNWIWDEKFIFWIGSWASGCNSTFVCRQSQTRSLFCHSNFQNFLVSSLKWELKASEVMKMSCGML